MGGSSGTVRLGRRQGLDSHKLRSYGGVQPRGTEKGTDSDADNNYMICIYIYIFLYIYTYIYNNIIIISS